ncbi:MAG: molecular chaperone DnaK, partial [Bacilli bacterium]
IKAAQDDLQKDFYALSEKLYKQAEAAQNAQNANGAQSAQGTDANNQNSTNKDPNVVDADFTEVNDDDKKK